jgi:hypothetical protein
MSDPDSSTNGRDNRRTRREVLHRTGAAGILSLSLDVGLTGTTTAAQDTGGTLVLNVYVPGNDRDPGDSLSVIKTGFEEFETFGVSTSVNKREGEWSPPSDMTDAGSLLDHLASNTPDPADNAVQFGWIDEASNNGIAGGGNKHTIGAAHALGLNRDRPHDSIVQHEVTHCFDVNCSEHGNWLPEGTECIMSYYHANNGTDAWCSNCDTVLTNAVPDKAD